MNVWIVVLTWNGKEDTLELLTSLASSIDASTTVLVVDNDSADGTVEAVRAQFPWAQVLANRANLGYAAGNNRGIDLAKNSGAEVIVVLNNDTLVQPGFLPPLVARAFASRTAVSPDIRYASDPDVSWFYGAELRDSLPRHLPAEQQPSRSAAGPTDLLTGCCVAASAETWELIGGFDERYFLIFEDSDWSMRAASLGVELLLEPKSTVLHKVSRSFESSPRGVGRYYYARNGVRFNRRWCGWASALRFAWSHVARPSLRAAWQLRSLRRSGLVASTIGLIAGATGRGGPMGALTAWVCHWRAAPRPAAVDPHHHDLCESVAADRAGRDLEAETLDADRSSTHRGGRCSPDSPRSHV